ncbi:MAG TPA: AAA-like domain-containing protein, partial [Chthonomonadaceae bacterium]|nr:AAA-like domain-containing protein [Chthonomonadaceae bacterium]
MTTDSDFYVLGGTLPRDAPSYVARKADEELLDGLRRGQFCYVLTSRQMGKSSLMVRTVTRLRQERVTCLVIDLTSVGQNLTEEQWYDGLLNRLATQLDLEDELDDFWLDNTRLGPLQRWMHALKSVVLAHVKGRIALFVDEIDAVRSLPFSADEFFAAIRECYNRRTEDPDFERLAFCLFGVATPADLIRDTRSTPFNIGRRIELTDFTVAEAAPLMEGLRIRGQKAEARVQTPLLSQASGPAARQAGALSPGRQNAEARALLGRILYWTHGHPYLTQRLCQAVAEAEGTGVVEVDRICEELFLSPGAQNHDDNLLFVRERLLRSGEDVTGLLELYEQVWRGKRVKDDETSPRLSLLRLAGVLRVEGAYLKVRNRIYARVFDRNWVRNNIPNAELRRQKMAYRRGLFRAAAGGALIVALTSGMAWTAIQQSRRANANAERARMEADLASERERAAQHALYAADMSLAQQAWGTQNYGRVRELLQAWIPKPGKPDLRGFEWGLLWRRGHFDLPFLPLTTSYVYSGVAFSADGKTVRTNNGHGTILFWNAVTGEQIPKPVGQTFDLSAHHVSPDGKILAIGKHYYEEE